MRASKKTRPPICKAVRELRDALGLSQMALAVKMGWHATTVAKYETTDEPGKEALWALVKVASEAGHKELAARFATAAFSEITFTVPRGDIARAMARTLMILTRPEGDPGRAALLKLIDKETPQMRGK